MLGDTITGTTGGNVPLENRQPTLATGYMIAIQGIFPDVGNSDPAGTQPPDRSQPFIGEIKAVPFNFAPSGWMLCQGQSLPTNQNAALFALLGYAFGGSGANFNLPDLRERVPIGAGQGSGLPNYQLGDVVGTKNPVLSVANLPAHTHTVGAGNTAPVGSGTPLDNRQPSLALHFLITANGEIMIVAFAREPSGWCHCDGRLLDPATYSYLYGNIGTTYGGNGSTSFALPDLRGRVVLGDDGGGSWPLGLSYGNEDTVLTVSAIAAHTHTITGGATGSTGGPGSTANNYQPSLVLRQLMSFSGVFPTQGNGVSFPMVGEMRLIAGPAADGLTADQWFAMYGQLENISDNDTLFNVIGTTYGGDGQNTFALPDLRSRVDAGVNGTFPIGSAVGSGALGISVSQLAAHAHAMIPEITVEQPAGTSLVDGSGNVDFGTVGSNGGNVVKTFTIRNVGANNLLLGAITKDGANPGDFAVGSLGSTTLTPGANTTFTVTFSPAAAGSRSAAIHIPSNDTNQNPFDIAVIGTRLTHLQDWRLLYFNDTANSGAGADANDFDHDGLSNILEFAIGGDPKHFTAMPGAVTRVGNTMSFTYQRSKGAIADGFTFSVEFRVNLVAGSWSNANVTEQILSQDANFQQVKASRDLSDTPGTAGFMRLNVSPPP